MQIYEQFTVSQPIERVWGLFCDIPEVARCLPGAELKSDNGDGTYDGAVAVKLGPISASFEGTATVTFDKDAYASNTKGRGVDRAGGSQGSVDVDVQLSEIDGGHTDVRIEAKVTLAGAIAQFGRTGLVNEVSKRVIDQFSDCLHAKLDAESEEAAAEVEAPDVRGLSLGLAAAWASFTGWLKRLFTRSES
jgi:carbon-monoxide dehydrogenase small subunit